MLPYPVLCRRSDGMHIMAPTGLKMYIQTKRILYQPGRRLTMSPVATHQSTGDFAHICNYFLSLWIAGSCVEHRLFPLLLCWLPFLALYALKIMLTPHRAFFGATSISFRFGFFLWGVVINYDYYFYLLAVMSSCFVLYKGWPYSGVCVGRAGLVSFVW